MLERPRFVWFRRVFFPYSGEEALTPAQARRMVVVWALGFSAVLTLVTLPTALVVGPVSGSRLALILVLTFLGSCILFGLMACFIVAILNRSAHIRRQWKEQKAATMSSTRGGRYGSEC